MDWYCAVWNSDSVSSEVGAQVLYEMLCQGDTSLVGDIEVIKEFYDELLLKSLPIQAHKGKGFVIISCNFDYAEYIDEKVQGIAKLHGLSYFEPQNLTYVF